jgi:hypothetical protein
MKLKEKLCRKCNLEKEIKYFYRNPDSPDGYRNICKSCERVIKMTAKRKVQLNSPFFSSEIFSLIKHHKFKEVAKFGYFYGILIWVRKYDILAFSVVRFDTKGAKVFHKEQEARAWLYKKMIEAGQRTELGLTKYTRRVFK